MFFIILCRRIRPVQVHYLIIKDLLASAECPKNPKTGFTRPFKIINNKGQVNGRVSTCL